MARERTAPSRLSNRRDVRAGGSPPKASAKPDRPDGARILSLTRDRILIAAERLFAERGFRGTSVRAITDLAGANLAAVGYQIGRAHV